MNDVPPVEEVGADDEQDDERRDDDTEGEAGRVATRFLLIAV